MSDTPTPTQPDDDDPTEPTGNPPTGDDDPTPQAVPTTRTKDYIGRSLINTTPGTSDATDFLFRGIKAGDVDYLGRVLVA